MKTDPRSACNNLDEHLFWALVHDFLCHPLMAISLYSSWSIRFHDWTSSHAWPRNKGKAGKPIAMNSKYGPLMVRLVSDGIYCIDHFNVKHVLMVNAEDAIEACEKAEDWFDVLEVEFGGDFAAPDIDHPAGLKRR